MKKQLNQVLDFHKKFKNPIWNKIKNIPEERYNFRHSLITEEINEYLEWAKKWDKENIAKELCDILFSTYWAIIEHWLQDKIEECFDEVYRSNMSKEYTISYKMHKWKDYSPADLNIIIKS